MAVESLHHTLHKSWRSLIHMQKLDVTDSYGKHKSWTSLIHMENIFFGQEDLSKPVTLIHMQNKIAVLKAYGQPVRERGPAGSGGKSTASKREQI